MKKGTYVKRSSYQKVKEENKKLVDDLRIVTQENFTYEKISIIQKWRSKFNRDDSFMLMMKGITKQYLKEKKKNKKRI